MYTTLFKNIFLRTTYDERSRHDFIKYCRMKPSDNFTFDEAVLTDFEKNYRAENAVNWYTRETFIYKLLSRAIRLLEIETLIQMGFFIADLHRQIKQMYYRQIAWYDGKSFIVYRGQIFPFLKERVIA